LAQAIAWGPSVTEIVNSFLLVYASLFPIVNPIGLAPIFLVWTKDCTEAERRSLAFQVARNGFFLLLGSLFVGSHVLEFFGITLPIVRVAGGMVVTALGWRLLHAAGESDQQLEADVVRHAAARPDAFYPLTMPLTVGPGSIAVAIALGSQRPTGDIGHLAMLGTSAVAGLVAVAVTIYVAYRFAERTASALGERGMNVVVRLSAFILLCIGIQIAWNGCRVLIGDVP
jgi:multiple antibiotic resistance protein